MSNDRLSRNVSQFAEAIMTYKAAKDFIVKNKLWAGFLKHRFAALASIVVSLVVTWAFIQIIAKWFEKINAPITSAEGGILESSAHMFSEVGTFGYDLFYNSGIKYLLLILLEIVIFHFSVQTLNILRNESFQPKFKDFVKAEKRMISVSFRCWILELILTFAISTGLSIIGVEWAKYLPIFFIHCYFMGFALLDNYNEQYNLTVEESAKSVRHFAGASIGLGAVCYLLLLVPLAGAIIGPVLGAVSAAIYMYTTGLHREDERFVVPSISIV